MLCSNAEQSDGEDGPIGSPTEAALLVAAAENGIQVRAARREWPRLAEIPFSSDRKRMATLHRTPSEQTVLYVKGAAERILERTPGRRRDGGRVATENG